MDRRELLKMIAALTGGAVIGGEIFLSSGCKTSDSTTVNGFSQDDVALLDEVAETILPKTNTPGAKDAEVGKFMTAMVNDCYEPKERETFHEGIKKLNEAGENKYKAKFVTLTTEQKHDLLVSLDKEAKEYQTKKSAFDGEQNAKAKSELDKGNPNFKKETMAPHYFTMMKQLTLLGFFTSKPGATQALRYIAVPGRFDGAMPYKKGDRAWA